MKKNGKGGAGRLGGDSWLITFNDLMTLVLTFFVLLLAFSVMKPDYVVQAANSFRNTVAGGITTGGGVMRVFQPFVKPFSDPDIEMEKRKRALIKDEETLRRIKTNLTNIRGIAFGSLTAVPSQGLKLSLPPALLFESEGHRLGIQGREILTHISAALKGEAIFVHVELQDAATFLSGALLSAETESLLRTATVARYLSSLGGLDASRITVGTDRKKGNGNYGREEKTLEPKTMDIYISTRPL